MKRCRSDLLLTTSLTETQYGSHASASMSSGRDAVALGHRPLQPSLTASPHPHDGVARKQRKQNQNLHVSDQGVRPARRRARDPCWAAAALLLLPQKVPRH